MKHPLRKWLDEHGLKNQWVAKKLGIHETVLSTYLKSTRIPRIPLMLKIEEMTKGEVNARNWYKHSLQIEDSSE